MRYFVLMSDGRVVGAQNVYKGKFDGSTFFTADNLRYKYSPLTCFEERGGWLYPAFNRRFYKQSPDADNTEWSVTSDIERILFLNEEENDELNYFQSTDFNAGVIYGMIEKEIGKLFSNTSTKCIEKEIRLPKIQVVLKGAMCPTDILDTTMATVLEHFAAVYGNHFDIEMRHYDDVNHKQYIVFHVQVTRKEPVKEMTIAEIEEALGYKIKVVGDKV